MKLTQIIDNAPVQLGETSGADLYKFMEDTNRLRGAMEAYRGALLAQARAGMPGITKEFVQQFEAVRRGMNQISRQNEPEQYGDDNYPTLPQ